jgi:hypothetical protein
MNNCKNCNLYAAKGNLDICKKCYYTEYHKKTYQKMKHFCSVCGKEHHLGRTKYCNECRQSLESTCKDCGKSFRYKFEPIF